MKRDIIDYGDRPKLIYLYAWYEANGTIGHITYRGRTYEAKYVGQAFMDGLEQRQGKNGQGYTASGKQPKIELAIKKYGWDNRRQMILTSNIKTNIEADSMEDFWIDRLDSLNNGLNAILNRFIYGEYQLGDKIKYADYLEERFDILSEAQCEAQNNPETNKQRSESASKSIIAYYFKDDTRTKIERIPFKSVLEAQEKTGIEASNIAKFIKGTSKSSYIGKINGMRCIWSYADKPYTDQQAIEKLNEAYRSKSGGKRVKRPIIVINVLTKEAKPYEGQRKALRKLNISRGGISEACNGIYQKNSHLYDNWLCYFQQDWDSFSQEQQEQLILDAIELYNSRPKPHHERILAKDKKTGEETILADMNKAMEFVGVRNNAHISSACYGEGYGKDGHYFKNYYWYYIDDNDNIIPDNEL